LYRLDDYDYSLPPSLVAQAPSPRRESSRLMLLDRFGGGVRHDRFDNLTAHLKSGDLLVLNDTRVVPARLAGFKESGGRVEVLILEPHRAEHEEKDGCECLVRAAKKVRPGQTLLFPQGVRARVTASPGEGRARLRFSSSRPLLEILEAVGRVPLPPYIRREEGARPPVDDRKVYQTVYAEKPGAVAAPTAGLHFSRELLDELEEKGVETVPVTLHVGYGTFSPIRVQDVRDHVMHPEFAEITAAAAARIRETRREGGRVVAVGTTVVRILEWVMKERGEMCEFSGWCSHFIYPGYSFGVVDAMITNFHLPRSSLLLLVSAFAKRENILAAYAQAVEEGYRFFSYGDAMLIH